MATYNIGRITATILSGATDSDVIDLAGRTLCGISMPAAFTGTALTFKIDNGGSTYQLMADGAGADVSKTVAASKYIKLNPSDFAGVDKLKLVSGSAEGADRQIVVHVRDVD